MLAADGTGCSGREQPLCPGSSSVFLATCEATLAGAGYGPGALDPDSQTGGQDSHFHKLGLYARRVWQVITAPKTAAQSSWGSREAVSVLGCPHRGLGSAPTHRRGGMDGMSGKSHRID